MIMLQKKKSEAIKMVTFPFISRAASFASAGLSNVTNAKPLDLFVSRSFIRITEIWK